MTRDQPSQSTAISSASQISGMRSSLSRPRLIRVRAMPLSWHRRGTRIALEAERLGVQFDGGPSRCAVLLDEDVIASFPHDVLYLVQRMIFGDDEA